MKNRYACNAKISESQFLELIRLFCMDLTAAQIALVLRLNRNTVNRYLLAIRQKIAYHFHRGDVYNVKHRELEVRPITGIRGRNPSTRNTVLWLFAAGETVYAEIVPKHLVSLMQAVMREKVRADGVLEGLGLTNCTAIADLSNKKIYCISNEGGESCCPPLEKKALLTPTGRFWRMLGGRLAKLRGIRADMLYLHIKETEFRFNHRNGVLHSLLITILEQNPLFSS